LFPERVKSYRLLRSENNVAFQEVARLAAGVHLYTDSDVEVHQREYYYRIEVINDCDLSGDSGVQSSSIYLQSEYDNYKTKLRWTPYTEWDSGVQIYKIEKLNNTGIWEQIRVVGGNEFESIFEE
jgi:hypothetical protein